MTIPTPDELSKALTAALMQIQLPCTAEDVKRTAVDVLMKHIKTEDHVEVIVHQDLTVILRPLTGLGAKMLEAAKGSS